MENKYARCAEFWREEEGRKLKLLFSEDQITVSQECLTPLSAALSLLRANCEGLSSHFPLVMAKVVQGELVVYRQLFLLHRLQRFFMAVAVKHFPSAVGPPILRIV